MFINGIQCDECKSIDNTLRPPEYVAESWFTVRQGQKDRMHFCSLHCLGQWTRSEEDKSTEGNSDNEYWRES